MRYEWTAPGAVINAFPSGSQSETLTFSFAPGTGTPEGILQVLQARELNAINDFASGFKALTLFSAPQTFTIVITPTPPTDGFGNFQVTAGTTFTASIAAR